MTSRREVMVCFDMVTKNAARTRGLGGYGVVEGNPASFVLMDAPDKWEGMRRLSAVTLVVKDGRGVRDQTGTDVAAEPSCEIRKIVGAAGWLSTVLRWSGDGSAIAAAPRLT